jgi:hypothetical protein
LGDAARDLVAVIGTGDARRAPGRGTALRVPYFHNREKALAQAKPGKGMRRLVTAVLLLGVALAAASCVGGTMADHIPVWAGGEPAGVPPRPGSPGYEEYRQKLDHPPAQAGDNTTGSGQPGQPGQTSQQAPASNGQQKN